MFGLASGRALVRRAHCFRAALPVRPALMRTLHHSNPLQSLSSHRDVKPATLERETLNFPISSQRLFMVIQPQMEVVVQQLRARFHIPPSVSIHLPTIYADFLVHLRDNGVALEDRPVPEVLASFIAYLTETVRNIAPAHQDLTPSEPAPLPEPDVDQQLQESIQAQLLLESRAVMSAAERYQQVVDQLVSSQRGGAIKPAQTFILEWFDPLVKAIQHEQQEKGKSGSGCSEQLAQVGAPELACMVMFEMFNLVLGSGKGVVAYTEAALHVGQAAQHELNLLHLKQNPTLWRTVTQHQRNKDQQKIVGLTSKHVPNSKLTINRATVKQFAEQNLAHLQWSHDTTAAVGGALIALLLKVSDAILDGAPIKVFKHSYQQGRHHKRVGIISIDPTVMKLIIDANEIVELLQPRFMPMLCPPKPWTAHNEGGYLSIPTSIMRTRGSKLQQQSLAESDLSQVFHGLNLLAEVPWRVNERVYEAMKYAWESGGGVADLPSRNDMPVPEKPDRDNPPAVFVDYLRMRNRANRSNTNLHSQRCDTALKMQVAEEFRGRPIYFPFNLDFRGRAYPVPPHLNHLGSDMCRGLLMFEHARPLGPRGMHWLKVHLANLFGHNKISFEQREQWVDQHLDEVIRSAEQPFGPHWQWGQQWKTLPSVDGMPGKDAPGQLVASEAVEQSKPWWLGAEDPWQALATCIEIRNAVQSGDPENYMCRLPVHQDGSCNGMQHYAALGRDAWGGSAVNLTPKELPADIYSGVCDQVNKLLAEQAEQGIPEAKLLVGHVNRKVVKQTVMTTVYGVTPLGARDQILNRLAEKKDLVLPEPREESLRTCAGFLAKLTFASLSDLFTCAFKNMDWLVECANLIGKAGQPVSWITPLGLPVIQPYRFEKKYEVQTSMQRVTVAEHNDLLPVATDRQRSAFPPNFVHSLDATHMLLTAIECGKRGLTFTAVHDSYWTHPGTADELAVLLREQFVNLYNQPLLENLRDSFIVRYPQIQFPELPERGELDLNEVMKSKYFFA